ncbi:uncharacterized protein K02A2.6-like [Microplitis mediator]|uniref:uncharacterized protein K02A2.6-like n=1 Tax=Microplitis mediator TaxID=375433 RepID=UPI002555DE2B|nr:uncharacterized protein K02A2.6-like [Microplitis mediator]
MYFDPSKPIIVTCDASPWGLGAVLAHETQTMGYRPVMYAARTLNKSEKNYSQIDREALAIIFAVKSFHQYIYGLRFTLGSDHKPLMYIFGEKKGVPVMSASRLQRWAVLLLAYDFQIKHISGKDNLVADFLSRLPDRTQQDSEVDDVENEYSYFNFIVDNSQIIDVSVLKIATEADEILLQLELSIENSCVMWGHRVVVPEKLRNKILKMLHETHSGIVKMKSIARSYIWWPGIDNDIEKLSNSCEICLMNSNKPNRSTLHVWPWPEGPNIRIHADFLEFAKRDAYLVIIDAYSKWVDIRAMKDITAPTTIAVFRTYFANWGLPMSLVTDYGPTFTSKEFKEFLERHGVIHMLTAPYHPESNGLAENAVKSFEAKFKLLLLNGYSRAEALDSYLFYYRSTPHGTTGLSPAELHLKRKVRTKWDLLTNKTRDKVENQQAAQQRNYRGNRSEKFDVNERVIVRDYSNKSWCPAIIFKIFSPITYKVRTDDNKIWKRHVDQIKRFKGEENEVENSVGNEMSLSESSQVNVSEAEVTKLVESESDVSHSRSNSLTSVKGLNKKVVAPLTRTTTVPVVARKSFRIRKLPVQLNL